MQSARLYRNFGMSLILAMSLYLFLPVASKAQTTLAKPARSENLWSDSTEVVVRAKLPGPPMWKLHKGDATVWVLAMPVLAVNNLTWDAGRFTRILKGADALYIPKQGKPTLQVAKIPMNKKLSDFLSEPTYKRVLKVLDRENLSHRFLLQIKPAYLGEQIYRRALFQRGIATGFNLDEVDQAVHETHVRVVNLPWQNLKVGLDFWASQSDEQAEYCLNLFLDGLDNDIRMAPIIAKAWAQGDLKTILADYQEDPWFSCIQSQPEFADEYRQVVDDPVTAQINDLLDGTGTTVMILPLSDALRKDGIFDRLREQGVEITSPPQ